MLIVTSSSPLSITIRFPVVEPRRLSCEVRVGAPAKQTTVLREMVVTPVCSLFPLEESEDQGDLCVWCCIGLRVGSMAKVHPLLLQFYCSLSRSLEGVLVLALWSVSGFLF